MTNQNAPPSRPSYEFRRRVSLAIGALAVIAVLQGAFALWAVSLAEHHILRGRVAADIKQGFTELKLVVSRDVV
jgi:two-component system OmpR family sensor kinase